MHILTILFIKKPNKYSSSFLNLEFAACTSLSLTQQFSAQDDCFLLTSSNVKRRSRFHRSKPSAGLKTMQGIQRSSLPRSRHDSSPASRCVVQHRIAHCLCSTPHKVLGVSTPQQMGKLSLNRTSINTSTCSNSSSFFNLQHEKT